MKPKTLKELIEKNLIVFVNPITRKVIQVDLTKLNGKDKYEVVEMVHGVVVYTKGIYTLSKIQEVVEEKPHTMYNLFLVGEKR